MNPIWSKGYGALTHTPKRYWSEMGAEDRRSFEYVRDMVLAIDRRLPHGQVMFLNLKIASSPDNNDVSTLLRLLPKLADRQLVLISSDGDNAIPSSVEGHEELLDHPHLLTWYTQNYDGSLTHEKLKPIPIGFDLHTLCTDFSEMQTIRDRFYKEERTGVVLDNLSISNADRAQVAITAARTKQITRLTRLPQTALWQLYCRFQYGISPSGNGLDCHRTWEMLFFGMIPIVKTSSLDVLYKDLPVVILQRWDELLDIEQVLAAWSIPQRPATTGRPFWDARHWIDDGLYQPLSSDTG